VEPWTPSSSPCSRHAPRARARARACDAPHASAQTPEAQLVPGWPGDPSYKSYVLSKQLPAAATAAALATFGRSGGRPRTAASKGNHAPRASLTSPTQAPPPPPAPSPGEAAEAGPDGPGPRQCVQKQSGRKGPTGAARTYTSRYRGVHQTFPTRRWEAQFRRAGKPTSLGCFDREEEAARAYDKMMLWCEIHHADLRSLGLLRNGVTNFEPACYAADMEALREMSQDDLVQELRRMGRLQAASGGRGMMAAAAEEA